MAGSSCENGIVVMHMTANRELSVYSSTVDVFGGMSSGNSNYENTVRVSLFCQPYDKESYMDHIVQCSIEGYERWWGTHSYTGAEPQTWDYDKRNFVEAFLITDIPRASMDIGGGEVITRMGHSGNISPYHFIVMHGNIAAIKAWVDRVSSTTVAVLKSTNVYYAETTNTITKFEGWEIDCIIFDRSRERYPYCGSVVKGQEDKGEQWLNLCGNPLGDCIDCCNCCDIGQRFLDVFKPSFLG